jgi:NAD(P)-dependent dehydrogenase (short-subunit alcohol dehydrogenase family)
MRSTEHRQSTIVITGVTRGLGRAMVHEFVRLGHTVLGCARTKREIEELTLLYPGQDFQTVDVASDGQVSRWAERLIAKYGPPDFLLNNAAVINLKAALWAVNIQEFSDEIDINIKGTVNVIRHFVPSMISRTHGVIVNFTSRWGTKCEKYMAPYCATKWAVVALTRTLAEELKPEGVAVVGLNPGVVKTGMLERYLGSGTAVLMSSYPTSSEWARIAVPFILRLNLNDSGKMRKILVPSTSSIDTSASATMKP